jgi:hypothetical protein
MNPSLSRLALALPLVVAACHTTESRTTIGTHEAAEPRLGVPTAAWTVHEAGQPAHSPLGEVVRFEDAGDPPGVMFLVRNRWSQDLGLVDELGRAWRFRPHGAEPEWVGTGTVAQGAGLILGARGDCRLEERRMTEFGVRPASADPR